MPSFEEQNPERESSSRDPETFAIIGAAMEAYKQLGCGFSAEVYREAMALEFAERDITYEADSHLPIRYKEQTLNSSCAVDFLCYRAVVVQIVAVAQLSPGEENSVPQILKAAERQRGLLINFGESSLRYRRFVRNYYPNT